MEYQMAKKLAAKPTTKKPVVAAKKPAAPKMAKMPAKTQVSTMKPCKDC
jgi:hypothetical protein